MTLTTIDLINDILNHDENYIDGIVYQQYELIDVCSDTGAQSSIKCDDELRDILRFFNQQAKERA
jgi:hypothetical protein